METIIMMKMSNSTRIWKRLILTVGVGMALALAGCKASPPAAVPQTSAPSAAAPESSPTPAQPTPTQPPLAATVNGEWILLSDYQAEVQRNRNANEGVAPQNNQVLDDMINQLLLAQAAVKAGDTLDDAALQERINHLGDAQAVAAWIAANGYTGESFRRALRLSALAALQRDRITAAVPETAEQVHARQILVQDEATANNLETQLKNGADFMELAQRYDPVTGGELGWFPRGYLTQPEVEKAAFDLQPDQFSAVIQSAIGYHIVFVIERDPQHPLNPEARLALQAQALRDWLKQQRASSQINILQP